MREIFYKYNQRGLYETEQDTAFGNDSHVKITVEPHEFSIAIGGETLRSTSCGEYAVVTSHEGEVVFYDKENKVIGRADKTEKCYREIKLNWKQDFLSIQFGYTAVVDYYPDCDGEYDRWGKEWVAERTVTLSLKNNTVEVE